MPIYCHSHFPTQVYIHDADEYPVMDQGMIVLAPGEMTYVSIAKQQVSHRGCEV